MPNRLVLAKVLQSLLDMGSVVPARLRAHFDDQTSETIEQALRALSEVALQQHHRARASGTHEPMQEEQDVLLSEISTHAHAVQSDIYLASQEAARRILLIVGFARTLLDADRELEEQLGPDVGRYFEQLERLEFGEGTVSS